MQFEPLYYVGVGLVFFSIGVMLLTSVGQKIMEDIRKFEEAIENYRILPTKLIGLVAKIVIILELGIALLLLVPVNLQIGMVLLVIMGVIFSCAQLYVILQGRSISCGCHGDLSEKIGMKTLGFPLIFILVGVMGLMLSHFFKLPLDTFLSMFHFYILGGAIGCWIYKIAKSCASLLKEEVGH